MAGAAAVFFDVDFTLIHPGPRFQGIGYHASCARHGIAVDVRRFDEAVAGASTVLDAPDAMYDAAIYVAYTRRIIELMGGEGPALDRVARELYDEWAEHEHFSLYDDVAATLRTLRDRGLRLGLISNSHRCLVSFQTHFSLEGLIDAAISSSDCGYLKPHPRIFQAALDLTGVAPEDAVMVGDSFAHDVVGARRAGMRGILLARGPLRHAIDDDVETIRTLHELPAVIGPVAGAPARAGRADPCGDR